MFVKRLGDVAISALLLLLLSPILLGISLAILFTMGSPVLFRQKRPGLHKEPFYILKFRTMNDRRDKDGHSLSDAERETALGRILRSWSLDELPQLVNIIKGDMSLVGPRPMLEKYLENCTEHQLRRLEIRPGVTGLAQINGRKALDYEKRFELDVRYVDNWTLWLDLTILLATPSIVLGRDGSEETGQPIIAQSAPESEVDLAA